jgi:hypothetical protein
MAEDTYADEKTVHGTFSTRAAAEDARGRLRDRDCSCEIEGGDGEETRVTVHAEDQEALRSAEAVLRDAGAERVTRGSDRFGPPREVQPGFSDAPPGLTPKAADFPADEYESAGARFAKQIGDAPETPDEKDRS